MNEKYRIIYNTYSKRYEMDGQDLHCRETLDLFINNKWYSARVEFDSEEVKSLLSDLNIFIT